MDIIPSFDLLDGKLVRLRQGDFEQKSIAVSFKAGKQHFAFQELELNFDYFTQTFGGGVSGEPLRVSSLELVRTASNYAASRSLAREFHIIRTGGIATLQDVEESFSAGAALCQWYTGYFERFAEDGHSVYARLFGK